MTNLTDKWKKGELPEGFYYVKVNNKLTNDTVITECVNDYNLSGKFVPDLYEYDNDKIIEVLAPVPSYEKYLEMEGHCGAYSDINQWQKEEISGYKRLVAELKQENTKLKELLKECRRPVCWYVDIFKNKAEILTKIDELLK